MSLKSMIRNMTLNAVSQPFLFTHDCLSLFTGWGRIINISSTHGLVASPNKSAYIASKHGLIGLSKVFAWLGLYKQLLVSQLSMLVRDIYSHGEKMRCNSGCLASVCVLKLCGQQSSLLITLQHI